MAENRWRRFAVIAVCCLAPLLTSCSAVSLAPKGPEAGDKARCATWAKPKGLVWMKTSDFSVLVPKGWVNVTKTEQNTGAWAAFMDKKSSKSGFIDNIYIDRTKAGVDMSVTEMNIAITNEMRNALLSKIKISEFKARTPLSLGGIKASYLTGTGKVLGHRLGMTFIGVTDRNYRYGLAIAYTPGTRTGKAAFLKNLECSWTWANKA